MMYRNEEAEEYFKQVIIWLGQPEHRDKYIKYPDVVDAVPKEHHELVWSYLWYGHKTGSEPAAQLIEANKDVFLSNDRIDVRLNKAGLKYLEQLEEEHFQATGQQLYKIHSSVLPLSEVYEYVFQMHKKSEFFRVVWTKETYKFKPENLRVGLNALLHHKVIQKDTSTRHDITVLSPDVFEAASYSEAMKILAAKEKPLASIGIYAPNNKGAMSNSTGDGSTIQTTQTKTNAQSEKPEKKWWAKALGWIWDAVKKPIGAALVSFIFGVGTGKAIFSPSNDARYSNLTPRESKPNDSIRSGTGDSLSLRK